MTVGAPFANGFTPGYTTLLLPLLHGRRSKLVSSLLAQMLSIACVSKTI